MAKKKKKKNQICPQCAAQAANGAQGAAANAGAMGGLAGLLPAGRSEQFLLGAALGAAAAYVLSDEELRGKLFKAGLRLYTELAGGVAEMQEQMADLKAEMAAEQSGTP